MVLVIISSLMALPTVVVGLMVYSLICRSGPLGPYGLLFSPAAVILGQTVLVLPLVTSLIYGSVSDMDPQTAGNTENPWSKGLPLPLHACQGTEGTDSLGSSGRLRQGHRRGWGSP